MKKVCLITTRPDLIESVKNNHHTKDIFITSSDVIPNAEDYDLIVLTEYNSDLPKDTLNKCTVIRSHLSLLPAFDTQTPIKDAYLYGAKVSGVTVTLVKNSDLSGQILAQYPVLIDNFTNYNQLEEELYKLEQQLLPPVIKSITENKLFDIVDMLSDTTNHHCGGCGNCGKCK